MIKKKDAIEYFGNASKLAEALGISRQAVHKWGENVPDGSAYQLLRITEGKINKAA